MSSLDQGLLKIARLVNIRVNQEVLSSNQIIDRQKFISIPVGRDGDQFDFSRNLNVERNNIRSYFSIVCGSVAEKYLAVAKSGAGECAEMSSLACKYLSDYGVKNLYILLVEGDVRQKEHGGRHNHGFVLVHNSDEDLSPIFSFIKDLKDLKQLPDSVVAIDPFMKHVGLANKYTQEQKRYIKLYGFGDIIDLRLQPQDGIRLCYDLAQSKLQNPEAIRHKNKLDQLKSSARKKDPGPWFESMVCKKGSESSIHLG